MQCTIKVFLSQFYFDQRVLQLIRIFLRKNGNHFVSRRKNQKTNEVEFILVVESEKYWYNYRDIRQNTKWFALSKLILSSYLILINPINFQLNDEEWCEEFLFSLKISHTQHWDFGVIFKCKMTIQVTSVVYDCLMSKMEEYKSGDKCRISHLFRKGLELNIKKMDQISIVIAPKRWIFM